MTDAHPPVAKRIPKEITTHGDTRIDDYFWMRDRTDPDAVAYLEAENAYTAEVMKPTEALQQQLYKEILSRIREDDSGVPVLYRGNYYYSRTETGKAYAIHCRKLGSLEAPEEIMLDGNVLAAGQVYFRIGASSVSPDQNLLAYSTDLKGDETYTVRVKDLRTGTLLPDEIPNTSPSLEWAEDSRTFLYTVQDEAKRPYRVYRHELGGATDALVFEEEDARFELDLSKSRSHEYLFISSDSPLTSEVRTLRAAAPGDEPRVIFPREQGVEYDVEQQGEWLYVRTNEQATNFRLMRTRVDSPSKERWTEVIAGSESTIEAVDAFRDYLVVSERVRGLETIRIARTGAAGALEPWAPIDFPEPVYTVGVGANPEYDTRLLRFAYSSFVTPVSIYDYDMATRQRELKKQDVVVGGYDASLYESERLFARAPDGVEVPISLVYRKGLVRDGSRPMLLYGYGSYGLTSDPGFSSERLTLLNRGYTFAIAHIRGGGDLGKQWHEAGKLLHKKNTFTDFIACAEHLLQTGYTASDRLAILGGSAGGLLIGAVLNQRPELFRLAIARVPFVDTLNTMLDPTLPLTIQEYEEWGNPEELEFYRYIRSYSPYDNVEPQRYPAMLVKCGLNDPRVSYWEAAKWVAKLRATKKDENLLLLRTEMGAGHFGPSGRYEGLKQLAFDYAYLFTLFQT